MLFLALVGSGVARAEVLVSDGRVAMGTVLEITLAGAAPEGTFEALFAEAARLETLFSRHDPSSTLSALNRHAGEGPRRVEPELAQILADALVHARATRGAFDVTVGPLVRLWEASARRGVPPGAAELERLQARVGTHALQVALPDRVALRAGAAVDLGGIAKGWALDRVAGRLRAAGRSRALLAFGQSSFVALGAPPGAPGWRLLVRDAEDGFAGTVTLRDRALSVSASLGQWTEIAGRRYGHVLDPRSGTPLVRHRVTVVAARSAAEAEAWSTALLVLPAEQGLVLAEAKPGIEALLLEPGAWRRETSGFRSATGFEPLQAPSSTQASRSSGSS